MDHASHYTTSHSCSAKKKENILMSTIREIGLEETGLTHTAHHFYLNQKLRINTHHFAQNLR
jgi:hypothetical protein